MDNNEQQIIDKLKEDLINYEIFFNNSFQGFVIHREGEFIIANRAFLDMGGIKEGELYKYNIYDFLTEESIAKVKKSIENRFEGVYELTGKKKNGEIMNLLVKVKKITYRNKPARAVFVNDITQERMQLQEAIKRENMIAQHRKILVTLAKLGIKTGLNYETTISNIIEIVSFITNSNYAAFFALSDDNNFLKPVSIYGNIKQDSYIKFNEIKNFIEQRTTVISNQEIINKIFNKLEIKDLNLILSPVRYENDFIGVTIFMRNRKQIWGYYEQDFIASVSDMIMLTFERWNKKLIENELNNTVRELQKLNRVKGDFISMVSHELRTPLTSIIGFVSFLLKGVAGKLNKQQIEFISSIKNNADRLLKLVNQLLDISRIEKGTFEIVKGRVDLIKVINNVLDNMKVIIVSKNIKIKTNFKEKKYIIKIDKEKITQIINNILDNAIKYSNKNIEIQIDVEKINNKSRKIPENIKRQIENKDYVFIKIKDNGIGIAKENLENIFNIFTQLENIDTRKHGGVGLGLYICRQIIKEHNGFIWAESDGVGFGTTFCILLPFY